MEPKGPERGKESTETPAGDSQCLLDMECCINHACLQMVATGEKADLLSAGINLPDITTSITLFLQACVPELCQEFLIILKTFIQI